MAFIIVHSLAASQAFTRLISCFVILFSLAFSLSSSTSSMKSHFSLRSFRILLLQAHCLRSLLTSNAEIYLFGFFSHHIFFSESLQIFRTFNEPFKPPWQHENQAYCL